MEEVVRLLTGFSPVAIETAPEHVRALKAADALMNKENRSPAETSLLKLLAVLIEDYEQKRYWLEDASPLEALKELMRARDMQPKDLWPVFGSKGITSEVLNGKRGISKENRPKAGRDVPRFPSGLYLAAADRAACFGSRQEPVPIKPLLGII
jgi:HTH-type transcriptional regulator/antitoxin HigA